MELTGRVTTDATVNTTKSGRKVVHFTIALNDRYKPKDSDTWKTLTTYVNCSYWMREGIARHLTKGTIAEVQGRISVSAWLNAQGEAKGSLNFHVNSVKLYGKTASLPNGTTPNAAEITEPIDDLPF